MPPPLTFDTQPQSPSAADLTETLILVQPLGLTFSVYSKARYPATRPQYDTDVFLYDRLISLYSVVNSTPTAQAQQHQTTIEAICTDLTNQDPLLLHRVKGILTFIYMDAV